MVRSKKSVGKSKLNQQVEKFETDTKQNSSGYVVDLRVHSPTALGWRKVEGIDSAPAMVRLAKVKGLDVLALTDFYSGAFIDKVREAADCQDLLILSGFDLRCRLGICDDAEFTCLLPDDYNSDLVQNVIKELGVPDSVAGDSSYKVNCSFEHLLKIIDSHNGVLLPSGMDRTPTRRIATEMLVEKYGFRAFDLARAESVKFFEEKWPDLDFHLFSFSNARALAQVGSRSATLNMPNCSFNSIKNIIERVEV